MSPEKWLIFLFLWIISGSEGSSAGRSGCETVLDKYFAVMIPFKALLIFIHVDWGSGIFAEKNGASDSDP